MFVQSEQSERNNYANAVRVALAAFKSDATREYYIVTIADFKRTKAYNAGGALKGLQAQLKALKSPHTAAKGTDSDTGEACVAIVNAAPKPKAVTPDAS